MGPLAQALLVPYYVVLGIYSLAATCVVAACLGALGMILVRDTGADVFDRPSSG